MTISSTTSRNDYTGSGAVSVYAYGFRIFTNADLLVTIRTTAGDESTLALTTDYTVSGVGELNGGNITLVNASQSWLTSGNLKSGYHLTIRRVLDLKQSTDIRNQGNYFPEDIEDEFDRGVMISQQQQDEVDRSIRIAETVASSGFDTSLPADIADHAGSAIIVNSTGTGLALGIENAGTDPSKVDKAGDTMTGDLGMLAQSAVKLYDADSSNIVTVVAPTDVTSDYSLTVPSAPPASTQTLQMSSTGTLSTISNTSLADTLGQAMTSGGANPIIAISSQNPSSVYNQYGIALSDYDGTTSVASTSDTYLTGTSKTIAAASVTTATDSFTSASHGWKTGQIVTVTTSGTLPAPLAISTNYYVIKTDANTFKLATSLANAIAGTNIDITTQGTGNHTFLATLNVALTTSGRPVEFFIQPGASSPSLNAGTILLNTGTSSDIITNVFVYLNGSVIKRFDIGTTFSGTGCDTNIPCSVIKIITEPVAGLNEFTVSARLALSGSSRSAIFKYLQLVAREIV